jgi:hypothetical protein
MTRYLGPSQASGSAFLQRAIAGEFVMLNLLRFREVADYSAHPDMAPETPISGAAAYDRYMAHTMPYLAASGGEVLFFGEGGPFLVGPPDERWDRAMLVLQGGVRQFMNFADNAGYLAGMGHRIAALEDSRLLPLSPL